MLPRDAYLLAENAKLKKQAAAASPPSRRAAAEAEPRAAAERASAERVASQKTDPRPRRAAPAVVGPIQELEATARGHGREP